MSQRITGPGGPSAPSQPTATLTRVLLACGAMAAQPLTELPGPAATGVGDASKVDSSPAGGLLVRITSRLRRHRDREPSRARPTHLHRPLAVLAALTGVLAVVLLPAMALDERQLLGVSVWLKPWKFVVSIAIDALTVAWMLILLQAGARLAHAAATGTAVALGSSWPSSPSRRPAGCPATSMTRAPWTVWCSTSWGPASIITVWVATGVVDLRSRPRACFPSSSPALPSAHDEPGMNRALAALTSKAEGRVAA